MSVRDDDLDRRLGGADPAGGLEFGEDFRARVWRDVSDRRGDAPSARARRRRRRHRRLLTLALPVALVLAGGAAAAATGVIAIGAPAAPFRFGNPDPLGVNLSDLGGRGAVHLLAVAAPDPQGGPPWGLRTVSTPSGYGCIEVGRIFEGRFGGIGEDGSFNDDGEFHAVPVIDAEDTAACTRLDSAGRLFYNVASAVGTASGTFFVPGGCVSARAFSHPLLELLERAPANSDLCPTASERTLIYGLLGPDAASVTYTLDGHSYTQATVGPQGAYLIVTGGERSADPELRDLPLAAGALPVDSPIIKITYRGGRVCGLLGARHDRYGAACLPGGHPVGYAAPRRAADSRHT